ncbi:MAG: hypothetical protein B6244_06505 [Candidatus Cloacimonetes bacterium 4572_55]|nr:MAG: hypothetical protein B6244_06505 [Candidatus Cloacimonetes bacterium 4572_55]
MTELLQTLLDLQDVDNQIRKSEEARDKLPQLISEYNDQVENMKEKIDYEREELNTMQKEKRSLEMELSVSENSRTAYETQLLEVNTAREYTALQHEIDSEKRKAARLEDEILGIMDKIEAKASKIAELEKEFNESSKEIKKNVSKLQGEYDSLDDRLEKQYKGRKKVMINVRPNLLSRYNRIWHSRRTPVVVPIKKNACSGCFRALPPQEINVARQRERLVICEGCGRMLYWPKEIGGFV